MWLPAMDDLMRVLLVTPVCYLAAVIAIRASGKRSLAKLNAFDLVVTVALGSVLASIVTSSELSVVTGLVGFALLLVMQVLISAWTAHHTDHDGMVRAEPTLLVRDGELLTDAIRQARLTPFEVFQAIRSSGQGGLDTVAAACLESDGTISVIPTSNLGDGRALDAVGSSGHVA